MSTYSFYILFEDILATKKIAKFIKNSVTKITQNGRLTQHTAHSEDVTRTMR